MSFDFAQIDLGGRPTGKTVQLSPDLYHRLFSSMSGEDFPILSRFTDYYEDISFLSHELPMLSAELRRYAQLLEGPAEVAVLVNMRLLVDESIKRQLLVEGIAD